MTADEPRRWVSVLMPTLATDIAWRPRRVSSSQAASSSASTTAPGHGSITHTDRKTTRTSSRRRFLRNAIEFSKASHRSH